MPHFLILTEIHVLLHATTLSQPMVNFYNAMLTYSLRATVQVTEEYVETVHFEAIRTEHSSRLPVSLYAQHGLDVMECQILHHLLRYSDQCLSRQQVQTLAVRRHFDHVHALT